MIHSGRPGTLVLVYVTFATIGSVILKVFAPCTIKLIP